MSGLEQPVTTYVFAGYDPSGGLTTTVNNLAQHPDVVIIRQQPGQSMAEAVQAAHIEPGSNIIVACHGSTDGRLEWRQGEARPYRDLFHALQPFGVKFISVTSCYGGMAQNDLSAVPAGATLQSFVGANSPDRGGSTETLGRLPNLRPAEMIIGALGAVNPKDYAAWNKEDHKGTTNPDEILPHVIGIGGHPPQTINLDETITRITKDAQQPTFNKPAFERATQQVLDTFNVGGTNGFQEKVQWPPQKAEPFKIAGFKLWDSTSPEPTGIYKEITRVAEKIEHGEALSPDEKRIGYALSVAYLDQSGELAQRMARAQEGKRWVQTAPQVSAQQPTVPTLGPVPPATAPQGRTPPAVQPQEEQLGFFGWLVGPSQSPPAPPVTPAAPLDATVALSSLSQEQKRYVQHSLNTSGARDENNHMLREDGKVGGHTLSAFSHLDPAAAVQLLKNAQAAVHPEITGGQSDNGESPNGGAGGGRHHGQHYTRS